jgi:hypothetical protein
MYRPIVAALAVALSVTACSGGSGGSAGTASSTSAVSPAPAATNLTGFPLFTGATVVSSNAFTQQVDTSAVKAGGGAFSQGSGTYAGHEVIAKSDATLDQLAQWLTDTSTTPPAGYTVPTQGAAQIAQAREQVKSFGIDFTPFQRTDNGKTVNVLVVAMDPAVLNAKLGPALGLIEKFKSLPEFAKGPIDAQIKARLGISATEALDPAAPLGAALAAYEDVKSSNSRAIVVVDAAKQ